LATDRSICIHGHFYQPPRENPWTGKVGRQASAAPFHDWNQRITSECYAPNAAARLLDSSGALLETLNNYSLISFDFGPTLLSWLEVNDPHTYSKVLEADRHSANAFSGHGSAMAQAYNHAIMPLADAETRRTQVAWGIADFKRRFGRQPEGMWLPETAADVPTLASLAEGGIKYTVLSPLQALRTRPAHSETWTEVGTGRIDSRRPYLVDLPSGEEMTIFFYDGGLSHGVAFGRLLEDGESFVRALRGSFSEGSRPELVSIATDGETYGHHRRFGEMALAYCLRHLGDGVRLTNYSEYLSLHTPEDYVEIVEPSSWSCPHGVLRWRGGCVCGSTGAPGWSSQWREALRETIDWLGSRIDAVYSEVGGQYLKDPVRARDDYCAAFLGGSDALDAFFSSHARTPVAGARGTMAELLEMERYGQLMYTSCGWFFEDISRIESKQVIAYALRAAQIAGQMAGADLVSGFLKRLESCTCNDPRYATGRTVAEEVLATSRTGPSRP